MPDKLSQRVHGDSQILRGCKLLISRSLVRLLLRTPFPGYKSEQIVILGIGSFPLNFNSFTDQKMIVAQPSPGFIRAGADPRQPAYAIVR